MGGRWGVGGEKLKIKLNSAQLELDLGLSLAIKQADLPFRLQFFEKEDQNSIHISILSGQLRPWSAGRV